MTKKKIQKVTEERMISLIDLEGYEKAGWKRNHAIGQASVLISREVEQEIEVPETELESVDRQIAELQDRRKHMTKEAKHHEDKGK